MAKEDKNKPGFASIPGCVALVTGSSGLCGSRLVEMLIERGAKHVIGFDLAAPDAVLTERFDTVMKKHKGSKIEIITGNLTNDNDVERCFQNNTIDICIHVAALVGPFHDRDLYLDVNYHGTLRIIKNCQKYKVPKLIYSSSPSTRFTGVDVEGLREDELPIPDKYLALYAETKAYGEKAVMEACCDDLLTVAIAPHQVYGPHDPLFLPNILETMGNGRLRLFGNGRSKISVCYVDNYCHGMLCGADALTKDSPILRKFYIVTDGPEVKFWQFINRVGMAMGFEDLNQKWPLPVWFLYAVAYVANVVGYVIGKKFKLNPFNVLMMTMHRYFSIENAKRDLHYEPIYTTEEGITITINWFKENWLPKFLESKKKQEKTKSE